MGFNNSKAETQADSHYASKCIGAGYNCFYYVSQADKHLQKILIGWMMKDTEQRDTISTHVCLSGERVPAQPCPFSQLLVFAYIGILP
jgi:hypothetical protein